MYDEVKEMSLRDFCHSVGSTEEPHHRDVEEFIDRIAVGGTRKVSDVRITEYTFSCSTLLCNIC